MCRYRALCLLAMPSLTGLTPTRFLTRGSPSPGRPSVCVTIREYGGGAASRQPSKLTFLNGSERAEGQTQVDGELVSELAATLSRSNLRTRTEDCVVESAAKEAAEVSSLWSGASSAVVSPPLLSVMGIEHALSHPLSTGAENRRRCGSQQRDRDCSEREYRLRLLPA